MVMWRIKSCPKCGGDIFLDSEDDILFDHCLQCSYMRMHTDESCPVCGFGMALVYAGGHKELHCDHCGLTSELKKVEQGKH